MNNIRVNINDALGAVSQNAIEAMASEVRSLSLIHISEPTRPY